MLLGFPDQGLYWAELPACCSYLRQSSNAVFWKVGNLRGLALRLVCPMHSRT